MMPVGPVRLGRLALNQEAEVQILDWQLVRGEGGDMEIDRRLVEISNLYPDQHVIPQDGNNHVAAPTCWCAPAVDYIHPTTGAKVWVHNRMEFDLSVIVAQAGEAG